MQLMRKHLSMVNQPVIHPVIFDDISEELVRKAAIRTKGGSDPFGIEADRRRKMLTSNVFGSCTYDLCKVIANFIKHIFISEIEFHNNTKSRGRFISSRLVPLDKNPGLRPIGVGEVFCHDYSEG